MFSALYTKPQLEQILDAWGLDNPVPKKGQVIIHSFSAGSTYPVGITLWTKNKSPQGKRLYRVRLGHKIEEIKKNVDS